MSHEMAVQQMALRDAAGTWYVLTPELLAKARASAEQQAALDEQVRGDTIGFGIIINQAGNYRSFPMLGGITLPAGANFPAARTEGIIINQ